ncbi:MAG: lytic transglycosylase domain-containing protein [Armatimonadota bacterium]|nr:lytic transglycosylase domain-containing protein [Armatimonadota bacterium]MDR7430777.1 lytic transglycosylase domain-containing protein [Armatimonadota bacterium]
MAVLVGPVAAQAAPAWQEQVRQAFGSGRYLEAAELAARAHAASPQDALSAAWAGASLALAGHPYRARPWLLRAAALDPGGRTGALARTWLASAAAVYDPALERLVRDLAAATNRRLTAEQAAWIARAVLFSAWLHRIDPLLLASVVHVESRWEHSSVSRAGAVGLGQLMPSTARGIGVDPRHPLHNLIGAARLLRGHMDAFRAAHDPLVAALSAYNAGSTATRRAGGRPPQAQTASYVREVLSVYVRLAARSAWIRR